MGFRHYCLEPCQGIRRREEGQERKAYVKACWKRLCLTLDSQRSNSTAGGTSDRSLERHHRDQMQ